MKLFSLPILIILYMVPTVAGPIEKVAELIRQGNVAELTKIFAPNVEVTIENEENLYSKVQAGLILDKFLSQNKPLSVKVLHKINSNPSYLLGVVILNTEKGPYRVSYTLKQADGGPILIDLHIETEKVK